MTGPIEPVVDSTNDGNPAWASVLDGIPSQFHDALKPKLEEWDRGVQERFQKVHSDYNDWKPFKEAGVQADQVNAALGLMNALENNPQEMLDTLRTYFEQQGVIQQAAQGIHGTNGNGNQQQGQTPQAPSVTALEDLDPRIAVKLKALEEQNTTLAQVLLQQQQDQVAKREDARLDQELNIIKSQFKQQHGYEPNERALLGYAQGLGVDLKTAAEHYAQDQAALLQNFRPVPPPPNLLGSGGNLPSQQTTLAGKSPAELDKIAVELLRGINQGKL